MTLVKYLDEEPVHGPTSCHRGRPIHSPVVRDIIRALGMETCSRCHRVIKIHGRNGVFYQRRDR